MSDPRFQDPIYSAGFVDGIFNEQERIIDLLKANFIDNELLDLAIALIKGENK